MSDSESEQAAEKKTQPIIKPHQNKVNDFYAEQLQANEEADSQAPLLVVVQGPKGSGKSTLIKSLVKHYTGQNLKTPIGPITVRSNKQHRVTFIECQSDINAMTDFAKIADLALILIDASVGFEMETFEFLSLLNNHGFPNIMGVLTHIDYFKDNKQLRKTRKKYKKRFEYETGGNYKLFNLSALKNEYYLKQDIHNLARFISIIKVTPVRWKSDHPFILADKLEQMGQLSIFYGYVRGCTYRINDRVHLVGNGDYYIESLEELKDPVEIMRKDTSRLRTLKDTEKIIYAPFSNIGSLTIDSAGDYITISKDNLIFTDKKLLQAEGMIDQASSEIEEEIDLGVRMVRDLQHLNEAIDKKLEAEEDVELFEGFQLSDENLGNQNDLLQREKNRELLRLKNRMNLKIENCAIAPLNSSLIAADLHELIYQSKNKVNEFDSARYIPICAERELYREIRGQFITGFFSQENIFEEKDLRIYQNQESSADPSEPEKEQLSQQGLQNSLNQQQRQQKVNEMHNQQLGLFRKGSYVRMIVKGVVHMPKPTYPIILARAEVGEENLGFVKVRIKKHRWHSNILKSNDPVIVSLGWRRFQTVPVYCVQDSNERLRFVKYTPEYDYCLAVFYGNFAPQGTGIVCTQTLSNKLSKFRIALTGVVIEMNHQFNIMKKLKLVGEPFKILKNTAFIKSMFNSSLEVAKFSGALIKTVSGIRGHIKKASKQGPEGSFRAMFEDKIQLSDLVFCRTWVRVEIQRYYQLIQIDNRNGRLMKTAWELRQENQLVLEFNPDSVYRNIERGPAKFNRLLIPSKLNENLPFESREKVKAFSMKERLRQKVERELPQKSQMTEKEKEVYTLIQRLNTIKNEKDRKREAKDKEKNKIKAAQEQGQKRHLEVGKRKYKQEKQKEKFRKKMNKQENGQI